MRTVGRGGPAPTVTDQPRPRGVALVELTIRRLCWLLWTVGALGVALYLFGESVSDRFEPTQWLSWIPTEASLASALLATLSALGGWASAAALRAPRRARARLRRAAVVGALAAVILGTFLLTVEHRPWRSRPTIPDGSFSLLHWNPRWPNRARTLPVAASLERIIEEYPLDLIVLTDTGLLLRDGRAVEIAMQGWTVVRSGPFAVLTRLPILELRALVRYDRVDVTLLRIDAGPLGVLPDPSRKDPHALTIWLVDLPSDTDVGRMEMVRDLRARLDEVDAAKPDLVVGDMNMTRRSAALRALAPGTRPIFWEAGRGLGSTFPEPRPLWHVDHVLAGESIEAIDYVTHHTGASAHRAQHAVVRRRPPAGMRGGSQSPSSNSGTLPPS